MSAPSNIVIAPYVHDAGYYSSHHIDLRTDTRVVAIDRSASTVETAAGEQLGYDRLLLATGSRPRTLDLPGAELAGIHVLRTIADAGVLAKEFRAGQRIGVIGAGWIGSEVAASARQMGADVVVFDPGPVPLHRVLGREVGGIYRDLHEAHGVTFHFGSKVEGFEGTDHVTAVRTSNGDVAVDAVVLGVGASPRLELAEAAGLQIDDGIVVDEHLTSSDPHIFAAGDIAAAWHPNLGVRLRVDHWSNARHQATAAAKAMLGETTWYDRVPYFFSDQYDLGMEYRGFAFTWDDVVFRGDVTTNEFLAFWLLDGHVVAAMNANVWDRGAELDSLVKHRAPVDPEALRDHATPLSEVTLATTTTGGVPA